MKMTKTLLSITGALFVASVAMAAETTTAPAQGAAAGSANTGLNNEVKAINKDATKTTAQSDTAAPKKEKKAKKAKKHAK